MILHIFVLFLSFLQYDSSFMLNHSSSISRNRLGNPVNNLKIQISHLNCIIIYPIDFKFPPCAATQPGTISPDTVVAQGGHLFKSKAPRLCKSIG